MGWWMSVVGSKWGGGCLWWAVSGVVGVCGGQ